MVFERLYFEQSCIILRSLVKLLGKCSYMNALHKNFASTECDGT